MKTDQQVRRNVWSVCMALARKGLIPIHGIMSSARVVRNDGQEAYWVAYLTPTPVPGDEWKGR